MFSFSYFCTAYSGARSRARRGIERRVKERGRERGQRKGLTRGVKEKGQRDVVVTRGNENGHGKRVEKVGLKRWWAMNGWGMESGQRVGQQERDYEMRGNAREYCKTFYA